MKNTPRQFSHIDTWVFDLDNTLYPHHVNLWHQVDARIGEFVGAFLGVSPEEARRIQKDYYRRYGSYYGPGYCDAYDYQTGYCG